MTDPDPATTADVLRREERKRLYANGYQDGAAAERQRIRDRVASSGHSRCCLSWIETLVLDGEGNE